MDTLPGLLIFNRKEVVVTKNKTKVKAVSSCLIKYIFIVISCLLPQIVLTKSIDSKYLKKNRLVKLF